MNVSAWCLDDLQGFCSSDQIMAPSKMKLRVKKKDSCGKSSQRLLANASPDSKCPICLDGFKNMASLDRCLHRFCFRCIQEWSKNKAECPLCKQPFHSIFHSVKGENDFKEFVLRPAENLAPNDGTSGRVLRPRVLRGRERRSRRSQQPARSSPPPVDDDVMFGGLTDAAAFTDNQDMEQMVIRLRARRRGRGEGQSQSLRRLRDQDVVAFRRALYRTGVRVRNTRDAGRQREVSAAYLRQNPTCLHRLLPWLQRELTVLYGSHGSLVNIVQHIIMSRITNYNMEESAIRDELRPFLLARTDHFLHELVSFARSTLSMEAYDQQAVYDCPAPSYEEGSSSDDSVIAISEDEDDDNNDSEDNVMENPSIVQELLSIPTASGAESLLSQSGWDDEMPGPSYSTLFPFSSLSQDEGVEPSSSTDLVLTTMKMTDPAASASVSARPSEDDEEECLIVGYVKPMAERTPELVQLSSDSSEEEQEAAAATDAMATVTKSETSQVQAPSQSHGNPLSPGSSPGPARSCSPQHIHSDSHNRERATESHSPSSRGHHMHRHQHRSREGSRSRSQGNQDCSGFSCHKRQDDSHRRSDSKESDKGLERSQHASNPGRSPSQTILHQSWSGQSPTMSIWSGNESSPFRNNASSDRSQERSQHVSDRCSQSPSDWEKERGRTRTRKRTRRSADLDSFLGIHHPRRRSRKSQRCRKRRRRSISSSSSDDLHLERFCLDKPSGKRKYKTRHLERAAQRQHKEGTTSKVKRPGHRGRRHSRECPQSRSPSVEIIYERSVPDMHWHQRRKKRHRKRRREQRSPTVITIDSDSDRTIDCLDRVMDIIDKTASGGDDDEQKDDSAQQGIGATLPSTNTLLESSIPVSRSDQVSPDHMLDLDDCVVDVVDHNSSDALNCTQNTDTNSLHADNLLESVPDPFSVVSVATTPPSDTGLLESILQDLKEFLPGLNQEADQNHL
ncbi:E3 ubiquitin-protein ligase Topors [Xyrauchen texanus]|uniref:E3 ubiquitin-protein ligase Topors n=1 Tax=Xyrauchen texanus TaxID=154827 RepID=UPI0022418764|nr:E3 ubiquitin-protein ligase Topors [Xyrauchen texanus]